MTKPFKLFYWKEVFSPAMISDARGTNKKDSQVVLVATSETILSNEQTLVRREFASTATAARSPEKLATISEGPKQVLKNTLYAGARRCGSEGRGFKSLN